MVDDIVKEPFKFGGGYEMLPTNKKNNYDRMKDCIETFIPEIKNKIIIDKTLDNNMGRRFRPDYLLEDLNLIFEYNGMQHYNNPFKLKTDDIKKEIYANHKNKKGINKKYATIRWPYFYQLTKPIAKFIFGDLMKHFHFSMNITQINKNGYYSDEKYYEAIKKIYKNPFDSERKKWATKENHVLSPGFHGTKEVPAAFCDKGIDRYIEDLKWECDAKNKGCPCNAKAPESTKHQLKHSLDLYLKDLKNLEEEWLIIPKNNKKYNEFFNFIPDKKYLNLFYGRDASTYIK